MRRTAWTSRPARRGRRGGAGGHPGRRVHPGAGAPAAGRGPQPGGVVSDHPPPAGITLRDVRSGAHRHELVPRVSRVSDRAGVGIFRQALDRRDCQHQLGDWVLVDLCKVQHPNGPSNRRRTASERIVPRQTLLKRAGEMAGVRLNLCVHPPASEDVVPIIRQDYDAVHIRRQPYIGIHISDDLGIEPRHRTVFARVASVHPQPVAQPSQVRCASKLLPRTPLPEPPSRNPGSS